MRGVTGAALELEERGFHSPICPDPGTKDGAKEHLRYHHPRPTGGMDGKRLEGSLDFAPGGGGMANRTDLYIEGKFRNEADPKDGYPVRDCRDEREHRVLEFLVPIVHPDKPIRVTRTLGNTIFGALSGDRTIDWAVIFMELVNRLVGGVGKAKPTPICPFLYHLYECKGLLTEEEETDYTTAKELNRYEIPPEQDEDSDSKVLRITGPEPQRASAPVN